MSCAALEERTLRPNSAGTYVSLPCASLVAAFAGTKNSFITECSVPFSSTYTSFVTSTGDVITTVAQNPGAIGYASVASVKDTVKLISVEGVTPSTKTIQDGSYKIQRNFVMVTKKNAELSPAAKSFFEFATSSAADEWIIEAGAVPVKR